MQTKRREDTIQPSCSPPLSLDLSLSLSISGSTPLLRRAVQETGYDHVYVCAFISKKKHIFLKHNRENKWGLFVVKAGLGVSIGPGPTSSRPSYAMTDMKRGWWLLAKWDR